MAGLVAGAVAVTIGMLAAGVIDVVSPIDAVGSEFIDRVPPWLKDLAIRWFGTNDKLVASIRKAIPDELPTVAPPRRKRAGRRQRSG